MTTTPTTTPHPTDSSLDQLTLTVTRADAHLIWHTLMATATETPNAETLAISIARQAEI